MKYIFLFLLVGFCSLPVWSENKITLTGTVLDKSTEKPVELASVSLLNAKDSSYVKGKVSSISGIFVFDNLNKGNYIIHVTYLGYQDLYQKVTLTEDVPNHNAGRLLLLTNDIMLQEAVVVGKAAEIVVKNDTVEYNADSYKVQENAAIEELLKKLPGVEVDKDGKITVNGKEVKKFLVEGKEFFSDDPQVASKNLPAQIVEKLQVLDRKSDMSRITGFDDGNEETVINITVKPGMRQGTMGNAAAGLGADLESQLNGQQDLRYEVGGMVNQMYNNDRYTLMFGGNNTNNLGASDLGGRRFGNMRGMRRGAGGINQSENLALNMNKEYSKLSLNGDITFNGSDRNASNEVESATLSGAHSQLDKTLTNDRDISDNFWTSFRLEWKPDSSNIFIFRPSFGYNNSSSEEQQVFGRFDYNTLDTLFDGRSSSYNEGEGYDIGASLEYAHMFKKPGRILSLRVSGNYNDSYSQGNSDWLQHIYSNGVYEKDSIRNQRSENDNRVKKYDLYTSYVEPLGRNYFIQLAYEINRSDNQSINSTYNLLGYDPITGGQPTIADTAVLSGRDSRSTMYKSTEQRFSLNFKSIREKYNYTVGLNVDPTSSNNDTYQPKEESISDLYLPIPYDKRLPNVIGDSVISEIPQRVVNFSPEINFNYLFGQRSNLRIDYSGTTTQPTATQLQDFVDQSNPMNLVKGNPDLKPGYTNNFSARYDKFVPESQLFYNVNLGGNYSINDITQVTRINDDNTRLTTYENISGNWNANLRAMFNVPLKNKKFTVGNFIMASYNSRKSYIYEKNTLPDEALLNTMGSIGLTDRMNINYRSELFDIGANGSLRYSRIENDVAPDKNQETYDWGVGGYTNWYLPYNLTVETDIDWTSRSGYADGFNLSETLWNAAVTKQIFNKKYGTGSLKFKIYDILQNRNNVSSSTNTNGYRYTRSSTIPSLFMCSFIYRFTVFPKGSSLKEDDMNPPRTWRGGGQGGGRRDRN